MKKNFDQSIKNTTRCTNGPGKYIKNLITNRSCCIQDASQLETGKGTKRSPYFAVGVQKMEKGRDNVG